MWKVFDVFLSKNVYLIIGLLGSIIFYFYGECRLYGALCDTAANYRDILIFSFYTPSILMASLIVYRLPDRIFKAWSHFTIVWVLFFGLLILISSGDSGGGYVMGGSPKGVFTIFSVVLYPIISLLIILTQSIRVYWLKK